MEGLKKKKKKKTLIFKFALPQFFFMMFTCDCGPAMAISVSVFNSCRLPPPPTLFYFFFKYILIPEEIISFVNCFLNKFYMSLFFEFFLLRAKM
ncbi:Uncharacterized protein APZ42_017432 [Daphnia magna]|uniref:Uncharacterized protein n=1 Tax=Daphnia magna TaxID=35525 RepID=A0A164ZVE2_9CRUS|nr:Uncharacterized protein APZ42_017432 [Daphnia magna]